MPSFPSVFLPGNFVQPQGGAGSPVKRLSYLQLKALRDAVGGGDIVARTPDPQARRYEFKNFLQQGIEKYAQDVPLSNIPHLAQYKEIVEGLIYGHVKLNPVDLRTFNMAIPDHLRYMGVLQNREGSVIGGTDPDILVFTASNAAEADFSALELLNNKVRHSEVGIRALELLRGFKETIVRADLWDPGKILWIQLLDRLFFSGPPRGPVNFDELLSGWKQIGPVMLRVTLAAGEQQYRSFYLPVYEKDYRQNSLVALSGAVAQEENALLLTVNHQPAGKIIWPTADAVGDQDLSLLGAGNLEPRQVADPIDIRVNYSDLRQLLHPVVYSVLQEPNPLNMVARKSPFSYPDVIRIPVQYEGLLAIQAFRGDANNEFGARFLERVRGKNLTTFPSMPAGENSPRLVQSEGNSYFVDLNHGQLAYYVEAYSDQTVEELSLLGYALWLIFDKTAELSANNSAMMVDGKTALEFNGVRFETGLDLVCRWPAFNEKIASLQRFAGLLGKDEICPLFRAAGRQWLTKGFDQAVQPHTAHPSPVTLGDRRWFVDNY
jgi:hypothetical protein